MLLQPVIQQDPTGCAFAAVAVLSGNDYATVKECANRLGISVSDPALWSGTAHIRQLLRQFGLQASAAKIPFTRWEQLPDTALLAIKWQRHDDAAQWHWVVFRRQSGQSLVFDSKAKLKQHCRNDFGRIKPKWYLAVDQAHATNT